MAGGSHSGRPASWVAVAIMIIGFTVGGVGLAMGPSWSVFWAGVAMVGIGGVLALVADIFADVVLDEPRVIPEIVDYSLTGDQSGRRRGGPYGETAERPTIREPEEPRPHG
ncbi:MAG TPA: HGxxPAAW family protein [Actinomadura sp.]|nr:HGxxPAAW family protein [Actinomadura sp.]